MALPMIKNGSEAVCQRTERSEGALVEPLFIRGKAMF
jgi:hypothetical protein